MYVSPYFLWNYLKLKVFTLIFWFREPFSWIIILHFAYIEHLIGVIVYKYEV